MKRIYTLASLFFAFAITGFAQGEMNAFNFSYNDLTGTARSVAMGGAFGALGGDASGVAINPAGIGVYKNSELVTTLNFTNTETSSKFLGGTTDDNKFKFSFDNLAFVGVVPLFSDEVPLINFGFAYNKLKSFDRNISVNGGQMGTSLTDYLSNRANGQNDFDYIANGDGYDGDFLSILSYESGLISKNPDGSKTFVPSSYGEKAKSRMNQRERGDISSFDFNVGTTISDMLSIGLTLSVTDIDYHLKSDYSEVFSNGDNYSLYNNLKTEGTGWQLKTGLIFKPINELRVGVAYHSPTWYNMTDYYYGEVRNYAGKSVSTPRDAYTDYEFRTPDKWVFSLAGIIGQYAIISADYELTNYGNMHLNNRYFGDYDYSVENQDIKSDFKNASTLRIGAEVRFTPQFSGRIGYMWQQSPVKEKLIEGSEDATYPAAVSGTVPQYSLVGDANYFTWGLGYRFTPAFYTDVAFVIKNRTDDFYNFPGAEKTELKNNQFTGLLTFGYKF